VLLSNKDLDMTDKPSLNDCVLGVFKSKALLVEETLQGLVVKGFDFSRLSIRSYVDRLSYEEIWFDNTPLLAIEIKIEGMSISTKMWPIRNDNDKK
jgi:hypothetical protein